jgi:hypothetical protein
MVYVNLKTPKMWCILFLKPSLYESVIDSNLVYINVMLHFSDK